MINFTVGPVQSSDAVLAIGAEQVPYFRTAEFSQLMLENEQLVKKFANATDNSRVVFLTCSGSGGMEAAIMNTLTKNDKALVINGGSFGERFVELLTRDIPLFFFFFMRLLQECIMMQNSLVISAKGMDVL